jgi:hypothetical protein
MCRRSLALVAAVLTLTVFVPALLQAQQSEIPARPPDETATVNDGPTERIVEGRPGMYPVKRVIHPISWLYAGIRPFLSIAEKAGTNNPSNTGSVPVSGMKFNLISLGPGSGVGVEIKPFHYDLFHRKVEVEVPLAVTHKLYESFGFSARYPLLSSDSAKRVALEFSGFYGSRPSENFFGIGNETVESNLSRFRSVTRTVAVSLDTRLTKNWTARVEARHRNVGITKPRNFPSTQEVGSKTLPGLQTGATMRSIAASLRYDTRNRTMLPGKGSLQLVEASVNEGVGADDFSYWRLRYDAQEYVPLSKDGRSVIALRGHMETNREKGGSGIPFFDLPAIGSPETLSGFEPRRFSDKSAVDFSAEYRYRIWRHFDWALFVSQGQVAPQIGDFGLHRFHTGYGMRFLVRPPGNHAIAMDIGHSREGWIFYLDFSPAF